MSRRGNSFMHYITQLRQILRRYGTSLPRRMLHAWSKGGWVELWGRAGDALGNHRPIAQFYGDWIKLHDTLSEEVRRQMRADTANWAKRPLITVLMPASHASVARTLAAISSCRTQLYQKWELCICLDAMAPPALRDLLEAIAQRDDRVRLVDTKNGDNGCATLNTALVGTSGEFFVLLNNTDVLSEHALYFVAKESVEYPAVDLMFSDEDEITADGLRFDPRFKSDWNPGLMLSCNAFGNLGAYRTSLVNKVGGFRPEFAERSNYDLVLRCAAATSSERIRHIPRVLYHKTHSSSADAESTTTTSTADFSNWEIGRKVIEQYLGQGGVNAKVEPTGRECYQVVYALPSEPARVSILLPSRCEPRLIEPCLKSLLTRTTYAHYEVLLIVNEQDQSAAGRVGALTQFVGSSRVRVVTYPHRPFNYSWVNNWAAGQASGDFLCFLNDDTTMITPDWLERLIARASLPGVAAAGPMLRYPDDRIQHAGVILGLGGVAGHACHGLPQGDCGYLDRACLEQDVSSLTAACLVLRKNLFDELGGFDEGLPIAYNDVDLCLRLRQAGWRLIWTPTVELYHHESASAGRHDAPQRREEFRGAVALDAGTMGSGSSARSLLQCQPITTERLASCLFSQRPATCLTHFPDHADLLDDAGRKKRQVKKEALLQSPIGAASPRSTMRLDKPPERPRGLQFALSLHDLTKSPCCRYHEPSTYCATRSRECSICSPTPEAVGWPYR